MRHAVGRGADLGGQEGGVIEAGQVWTPRLWGAVGKPREVVEVADGIVLFRAGDARVHRLNVADFATWAAYWGASHG